MTQPKPRITSYNFLIQITQVHGAAISANALANSVPGNTTIQIEVQVVNHTGSAVPVFVKCALLVHDNASGFSTIEVMGSGNIPPNNQNSPEVVEIPLVTPQNWAGTALLSAFLFLDDQGNPSDELAEPVGGYRLRKS